MKRIAVIGDLQYEESAKPVYDAFRDIAMLSPDVVILLGDYGRHSDYGTAAALDEIADAAKIFGGAVVCPIVGNHDLQNETGISKYPHGTFEGIMKAAFSLDEARNVLESDDFRLFAISLEPLPTHDIYADRATCESYISPDTMEFIERKLALRPEIPAIFFTHVPPICSGLKTVPNVHVRYTNAYLNQHHNPQMFAELIERFPQIAMWFCGHYHLGHHHWNSAQTRHGVSFFLTGVPTLNGRDKTRHTRIIDIEKERLVVRTFDHETQSLSIDMRHEGPIRELAKRRGKGTVYPLTWEEEHGKIMQILSGGGDIAYYLTDRGYVWEVDLRSAYVRGTLNYSKTFKPLQIFMEGGLIWLTDGVIERGFDPQNIHRFMMAYDDMAEYIERKPAIV